MPEYISVLYTSSDEKVWIGTMKGLFRYQNEKIQEVKPKNKSVLQFNSMIGIGTKSCILERTRAFSGIVRNLISY